MSKSMHTATELTRERVSIGQAHFANIRVADVRQKQSAAQRLLFNELYPFTGGGRTRVAKAADIVLGVIHDTPAVPVCTGIATMTGKLIERHTHCRQFLAGYCQ